MRRPVYGFGLAFCLACLAGAFVPLPALWLAAAFCAGAFAVFWRMPAGQRRFSVMLCCAVAALAFVWRGAYTLAVVRPAGALAGATAQVQAVVRQATASYLPGSVNATVHVTQMDGKPARLNAYLEAVPGLAQGDIFTAQLEFSTPENTSYARARRADGVYLDAAAQQVAVVGRQGGLAGAARQLREELCSALTRLLGQQVGSVARAAAFGDKSALSSELNEMFRAAGLSHVLVVSGLHFSAASGALYAFLRTKLRRRAAAVAAGGLVLWLLFLTGFGPSAVRSAVALLMLYGGMLAWRRSDGRTSMGVAGVLLCVFTGPDAALDVGAQLSFCAALAVVWAGEQTAVWNKREPGRFSFLLRPVRDALFVSACACLATLPALCAAGLGASLFTPLANLLALPSVSFAVLAGQGAAVCALCPPLGFLARLLGLVCGLAVRWLIFVCRLFSGLPGQVFASGAFALCVVCAGCALWFSQRRFRVPPHKAALASLAFAVLAMGGYALADAGVVHVTPVGGGVNPSLAITQGGFTAVVFRGGAQSAARVAEELAQMNRTEVDLVLDARVEPQREAVCDALSPAEYIAVSENSAAGGAYGPFRDIMFYTRRQGEGNFVCIQMGGYTLAATCGKVSAEGYAPVDVYFCASTQAEALSAGTVWLPAAPSITAQGTANCVRSGPQAALAVRGPGHARWKGVTNELS